MIASTSAAADSAKGVFSTKRYIGRASYRMVIAPLMVNAIRITDLAMLFLASLIAGELRFSDGVWPDIAKFALMTGLFSYLFIGSLLNIYNSNDVYRQPNLIFRAMLAWITAASTVLVLFYLVKHADALSRIWMVYWVIFGLAGLVVTRLTAHWISHLAITHGMLLSHVAIIGSKERMEEAVHRIGDVSQVLISANIAISPTLRIGDPKNLHEGSALETVHAKLRNQELDRIIIALSPHDQDQLDTILVWLRQYPISVVVLPVLPPANIPLLGMTEIGNVPVIRVLDRPIEEVNWIAKDIFDRLAACFLLVVFAPVLFIIGVLIKITSSGPVIYRQGRRGFNHDVIEVLKFRTMYTEHCDPTDATEVKQASKGDERITPIGRFLRQTSLDELPQLINVIKGDMSLVGPRPHALAHDDFYADRIDDYLSRRRVKPGITGWAQVNGCRGETKSVEAMRRRIECDLHYIDNWSLGLDIRILIRTLGVGFGGQNAY